MHLNGDCIVESPYEFCTWDVLGGLSISARPRHGFKKIIIFVLLICVCTMNDLLTLVFLIFF